MNSTGAVRRTFGPICSSVAGPSTVNGIASCLIAEIASSPTIVWPDLKDLKANLPTRNTNACNSISAYGNRIENIVVSWPKNPRLHLHNLRRLAPPRLLPCVLREQFLAQPNARRRGFDQFIFLDILQRLLKSILRAGLRMMFSSLDVVRMLVSFFAVVGLTVMSFSRAFSATIWPS